MPNTDADSTKAIIAKQTSQDKKSQVRRHRSTGPALLTGSGDRREMLANMDSSPYRAQDQLERRQRSRLGVDFKRPNDAR